MKILVFGNTLVKKDSMPIKILPKLRKKFPKVEFEELDGIDDLQRQGKDIVILDSVQGINKPVIIQDINKLESIRILGMHDFDLAYNLKLLKKIKALESITIIGIPMKISEKKALDGAAKLIQSIN